MTKLNRKSLCAIFSFIAIVAILFGFAPRITFASAATQDEYSGYFSGGDGSEANPYLITNEAELGHIVYVRNFDEDGYAYNDKSFKLVNDIYMTTDMWTPIGNYFQGTFDGNNKTIYNMKIIATHYTTENSNGFDFGFFRTIECGTVKNLNFSNANITCQDAVNYFNIGVIAGTNHGNIINCKVTNSTFNVTNAAGAYVGGICGYVFVGTVSNCINYTQIAGSRKFGGIVGYVRSGTITNCENHGKIIGSGQFGGIVGCAENITLIDCKNQNTITGSGNMGGIAGYAYSGKVQDCYNYGTITYLHSQENGCAAGIVGKADYMEITGCSNRGGIIYGSDKATGNSSIKPCMAQIVGWSINSTIRDCTITDGATDYSNLYKGLFVNQKKYCSAGNVGRDEYSE